MDSRRRRLTQNVSRTIPSIGSVIPNVAAGILQKKRKKGDWALNIKGGGLVDPRVQDNPYPLDHEQR